MWRSGVAIAFVCAALAGCAGASIGPRNGVPSAELADAARIDGIPAARAWGDFVPGDVATAIRQAFPGLPPIGANAQRTPDGRTVLDTLALSGGGGDGAYGAGLLVGWTKAGTRPEFEIVTGVSAGALTAPFAFLGPEYDPMLRELWTAFSTRELIVPRGLGGLLQGDALTDTAPLAQLIARYMNDAALAKIAAQYARGRALVVLTTNLDAQRPVVWNMGAIAASSDPRAPTLFRQVLLASAAIPSVFPPVNIDVVGADGKAYEELHVDGGITANMFISPFPVPLTAYNALYDRPPVRRIWVIKNGRTAPIQQVVQQRTLPIAGRSISTVLLSQNQGTLYRIYRRALDADAQFRFAAIPNGFRLLPREAFDPIYQTALFELAESRAAAGYPWLDRPPSQLPSAERAPPPRRFKVVKGPPGEEFTTEGFFGGLDLLR